LPQTLSTTLLAALLVLATGVWVTLIGYEYIGKRPGMELHPRFKDRQRLYRVGGPIVIALSLFVIGHALAGYFFAVRWRTYAPPDAPFTIDLPGAPVEKVVEERGPYGPVWNHFVKVAVQGRGISCLVRYTSLPAEFPDLAADKLQDMFKETVAETAKIAGGKVIEEKELAREQGAGRAFRIELQEGYVLRGEIFVLGRSQFLLQVVAPKAQADSEIPNRFFESFSYHGKSEK